ncbi:MAG: four helix bundle protein [Chitinophagaceae bacterium]|nr:four helix bundle protein [Chitinophagaceae bacterium]
MERRKPAVNFMDLIVWQKAHRFVIGVYQYTKNFPREEIYGLTSQFRRAAVSIAANIAEGFKKHGISDKARYLNIAQASLEECRYFLILANDLGFGRDEQLNLLLTETARLLESYRTTLIKSSGSPK